jgi:nucleotide-binding universal stress UspA family protein
VALAGIGEGLQALDQALVVARRETATLYGLHVVENEEEASGAEAASLREAFTTRCREAGVAHQFAVAVGDVVPRILERASWVDLVVAHLVYGAGEEAQLSSQYRSLLRRCPRPLLAVPHAHTDMKKLLLAYDGSARSEEALFAAAYASAKWDASLVVLTVSELGRSASTTIKQALTYLERHDLEATYVEERGNVVDAVAETIEAHGCDAVFMGSYTYSRWLESMFGGVLEGVLTRSGKPVLIM